LGQGQHRRCGGERLEGADDRLTRPIERQVLRPSLGVGAKAADLDEELGRLEERRAAREDAGPLLQVGRIRIPRGGPGAGLEQHRVSGAEQRRDRDRREGDAPFVREGLAGDADLHALPPFALPVPPESGGAYHLRSPLAPAGLPRRPRFAKLVPAAAGGRAGATGRRRDGHRWRSRRSRSRSRGRSSGRSHGRGRSQSWSPGRSRIGGRDLHRTRNLSRDQRRSRRCVCTRARSRPCCGARGWSTRSSSASTATPRTTPARTAAATATGARSATGSRGSSTVTSSSAPTPSSCCARSSARPGSAASSSSGRG